MYAHMCSRSTTPVSSCSAPIGSWIATQRSDSCARAASRTRKKSARSRSSMLTTITRDSSYSSARFHTRDVVTSTPMTPLITTSAPSTTRNAANVSAWKPGSPGQSTRLILRSCHSRWSSEPESDICRLCSSSSQSDAVVPLSIVPSRFVFPAWNSMASTSEVLPTPRWPTTAMLRIFPGSLTGTTQDLLGGVLAQRDRTTPLEITNLGDASVGSSRRASPSAARGDDEDDRSGRDPRGGSRLERGPGGGAREACLEAENRLRVQLRDAGLGHAEHLADLAEGQLLVVVERDHELLALGEARDRVRDRLFHLDLGELALRIGRVGVL